MTSIDPILTTVTVSRPSETAFDIFVDEVDRWWRPGPYFWNDPARAIGIRFQRGAGGRWIELYDDLGDDVFVMGEITASRTTGGAPLHLHRYDDEAFYVLEGTITITFDGETHTLPPGGFAFVPRGIPHAWDTIGEAHVLIVTAPGGLEEFLAALHTWPGGYADAWRVLGERYGYTLL